MIHILYIDILDIYRYRHMETIAQRTEKSQWNCSGIRFLHFR